MFYCRQRNPEEPQSHRARPCTAGGPCTAAATACVTFGRAAPKACHACDRADAARLACPPSTDVPAQHAVAPYVTLLKRLQRLRSRHQAQAQRTLPYSCAAAPTAAPRCWPSCACYTSMQLRSPHAQCVGIPRAAPRYDGVRGGREALAPPCALPRRAGRATRRRLRRPQGAGTPRR
jgi:hypothetical protein